MILIESRPRAAAASGSTDVGTTNAFLYRFGTISQSSGAATQSRSRPRALGERSATSDGGCSKRTAPRVGRTLSGNTGSRFYVRPTQEQQSQIREFASRVASLTWPAVSDQMTAVG